MAHNTGVLEFSRQPESDPALGTPRPDAIEPPLPEDFRKWVERAFQGITLNIHFTQIDSWFTRPPKPEALGTNLLYWIQSEAGLAAGKSAPDQKLLESYQWLRNEAVGAAAERIALAQRTFLWALEWLNAAEHLDLYCKAHGNFPSTHPIAVLRREVAGALPVRTELVATNADSERMDHVSVDRLSRLEERISSAQLLIGGLLCFNEFFVPEDRVDDLPKALPRRDLESCLGFGTGWLLSQLHSDAYGLSNGLLLGWDCDEIAKQWVIVGNGVQDPELSSQASKLAASLGMTGLSDAEGIQACVSSHAQMVKQAASNPDQTLAARVCESHMMQLLNVLFDCAISSPGTRHNATDQPDSLPKPEDALKDKCDLMTKYWAINHDPQAPSTR